jgi:hypothetical protein
VRRLPCDEIYAEVIGKPGLSREKLSGASMNFRLGARRRGQEVDGRRAAVNLGGALQLYFAHGARCAHSGAALRMHRDARSMGRSRSAIEQSAALLINPAVPGIHRTQIERATGALARLYRFDAQVASAFRCATS